MKSNSRFESAEQLQHLLVEKDAVIKRLTSEIAQERKGRENDAKELVQRARMINSFREQLSSRGTPSGNSVPSPAQRKQLTDYVNQKRALESEIAALKAKQESLEQRNADLEAHIAELQEKLNDLESQLQERNSSINASVSHPEEENSEEACKSENCQLHQRLTMLQEKLEAYELGSDIVKEREIKCSELERECNELQQQCQKDKAELNAMKAALEEEAKRLGEREAQVVHLVNAVEQASRERRVTEHIQRGLQRGRQALRRKAGYISARARINLGVELRQAEYVAKNNEAARRLRKITTDAEAAKAAAQAKEDSAKKAAREAELKVESLQSKLASIISTHVDSHKDTCEKLTGQMMKRQEESRRQQEEQVRQLERQRGAAQEALNSLLKQRDEIKVEVDRLLDQAKKSEHQSSLVELTARRQTECLRFHQDRVTQREICAESLLRDLTVVDRSMRRCNEIFIDSLSRLLGMFGFRCNSQALNHFQHLPRTTLFGSLESYKMLQDTSDIESELAAPISATLASAPLTLAPAPSTLVSAPLTLAPAPSTLASAPSTLAPTPSTLPSSVPTPSVQGDEAPAAATSGSEAGDEPKFEDHTKENAKPAKSVDSSPPTATQKGGKAMYNMVANKKQQKAEKEAHEPPAKSTPTIITAKQAPKKDKAERVLDAKAFEKTVASLSPEGILLEELAVIERKVEELSLMMSRILDAIDARIVQSASRQAEPKSVALAESLKAAEEEVDRMVADLAKAKEEYSKIEEACASRRHELAALGTQKGEVSQEIAQLEEERVAKELVCKSQEKLLEEMKRELARLQQEKERKTEDLRFQSLDERLKEAEAASRRGCVTDDLAEQKKNDLLQFITQLGPSDVMPNFTRK